MDTHSLNILELPDITRLTSYVLTDSNLEAQSKHVVKGVKEIFDADACIIRILKKNKLVILASIGVKSENLLLSLPSNKGLAFKMLSTDKPVKIFDVNADPVTINMLNRNKNEFKFVSFAGAPLKVNGKQFGVIGIYITKSKREFTDTELEKLKIVANQIAIRLENVRLYDALNQNAKKMKKEVKTRLATEKKLRVALRETENSAKIKSEFFAQISHEIRTPVNTLLNFTGLIREEFENKLQGEMRDSFDIINRAGKRLLRTIDLILDMTDLQAGTYEYFPQQINLKVMLDETIAEYFLPAKKKSINLIVSYAAADYDAFLDEYTIKQIFVNLLENSIKFSDKGTVKITTKCINKKLSIIFEDEGIGIGKEFLSNIFEPFRQEHQGYSRRYEGNGLGLALVKIFCDLNKIKILVESKKWEGTKFTLVFLRNNL